MAGLPCSQTLAAHGAESVTRKASVASWALSRTSTSSLGSVGVTEDEVLAFMQRHEQLTPALNQPPALVRRLEAQVACA